jgi:hypothetical protein
MSRYSTSPPPKSATALFAGAFNQPGWGFLQKPQISGIDNQVLPLLHATGDDGQNTRFS